MIEQRECRQSFPGMRIWRKRDRELNDHYLHGWNLDEVLPQLLAAVTRRATRLSNPLNALLFAPVRAAGRRGRRPAPVVAVDPLQYEVLTVPHYGIRRKTADYEVEEGRRQELLENRLSEYQYLHGQVYLDPANDTFYEVIDTVMKRRMAKNGGPVVTVISWPINADGEFVITGEEQLNEDLWQERPYLEVQDLIDEQLRRIDPLVDRRFPVDQSEWTELQLQDEWCARVMAQLTGQEFFNLPTRPS